MNSATFNGAGDSPVLTKLTTSEGHRRNVSADSGHFDMSGIVDGNSEYDSTMADLSQEEDGTTDPPSVRRKLSESQRVRESLDSGVGGSIESQESMVLDESGSFRGNSHLQQEKENESECEMGVDDQLQPEAPAEGEDCPDFPESVASEAVRRSYSSLVEVISHQISVDHLASVLYSHSLIENTVHEEVRVQGVTDERKTHRVLGAVMSKLRTSECVELFERFVKVLASFPSCSDLVVQIEVVYRQLQQSSEASDSGKQHVHEYAREEMVFGNSRVTTVMPQCQGSLQSLVKDKQPTPSPSGTNESSISNYPRGLKRSICSMVRQRSLSSGAESDVSMTEEEIYEGLKKWQRYSKRLTRGIQRHMDRQQEAASTMEEIVHRLESTVEDMQTQVDEYKTKLERCNDEKQVLERQLLIARRQILQLNREVTDLKQHPCTSACEHKAKCERLERQIKRLEEEKLDYVAKIENLTQQQDLLLNGYV